MLRLTLLVLALVTSLPAGSAAQWRVGLELGVERIPVMARDTEDPDEIIRMRPTAGWPVALRVSRGGDRLRAGFSIQRSAPGFEIDGPGLTVAMRPAFRVLSLTPELSGRLARVGIHGALRAHLGAPVERWSFVGATDPARWRAGVSTGLTLELPVGTTTSARLGGTVGTVFRNPLAATEMGDGYNPTRVWRRSLRIGVEKRW